MSAFVPAAAGLRRAPGIASTGRSYSTARSAVMRAPPFSVASTTTTTAQDGRYELLLDPGRSYRLWAQPTPAQPLGRAVLGSVTAGAADGSLPDRTVPRGLVFDAHVTGPAGPIGGALIQVFCLGAASCLDPTLSVADTISAADGAFQVMLPDPGAPN